MALRVGSAFADFDLSLTPFRTSVEVVKREVAALQAAVATSGRGSRVSPGEAGAARIAQETARAQAAAAVSAQRLQTEQNKTATAAQRLAQEQAKAAKAITDASRAEQLLVRDTANAAAAQDRATSAALRRAAAEERAARQSQNGGLGPALPRTFAGITEEGSAAIRSELLGLVGPAAIATAAIGGIGAAFRGVGDAARDSLNLQQIAAGLRTASGSAQTYAQALAIARENQILYGASAAEAQAALIGLANISRTSGVALGEIDAVVRQLKASDPAATFEDASIALREFLSGDITSLAERFELPRPALRALADDSVSAEEKIRRLNAMLLEAGFSATTAADAVPKATREINQLGVDADRVRIAVGGLFAALAGLAAQGANDGGGITKFADSVEQGGAIVTDALRRIGEGANPLDAFRAAVRASAEEMLGISGPAAVAGKGTDDYGVSALRAAEGLRGLSDTQRKTFAEQIEGARGAQQLAALQAQLDKDSRLAAQGLLGAGDQALILANKYGIAADEAQFLINKQQELTNGQALQDQRAGERGGGAFRTEREAEQAYRAGRIAADQAREAEAARRDQILATGTAAQKVALLQQEYNKAVADFGATSAQAIRAQTALQQAQRGGGGSVGAGGLTRDDRATLNLLDAEQRLAELKRRADAERNKSGTTYKELVGQIQDLEAKITSEKEKQAKAAIDAQLGAVRDAQARLKEARELAQNERIINGAGFSAEQKQAASLRNQEIALEQAKRAQEIAANSREAGAAATAIPQAAPTAQAVTQPLPLPNVAQLPPAVPTLAQTALSPVALTVNITIQDKQVANVQADPGVSLQTIVNGLRLGAAAGG